MATAVGELCGQPEAFVPLGRAPRVLRPPTKQDSPLHLQAQARPVEVSHLLTAEQGNLWLQGWMVWLVFFTCVSLTCCCLLLQTNLHVENYTEFLSFLGRTKVCVLYKGM